MASKQPTEVLELRGAFLKNPQRRRPPAPKSPHPLGDPPTWMTEEQQRTWVSVASELPDGVATRADRRAFSVLVRLTEELERGGDFGIQRVSLYRTYLGMFGMSPVDRTKLAVPKKDETKDDVAEFFSDTN